MPGGLLREKGGILPPGGPGGRGRAIGQEINQDHWKQRNSETHQDNPCPEVVACHWVGMVGHREASWVVDNLLEGMGDGLH